MAGFREFITGEVLTAGNVNDYLMQQSVMKFADSAARDTALGTAVGGGNALREGMVAYLDSTDEVQYYGGTAWAAVGSDPNPGIGTNVVQTVKTDAFTTTSSSFTTITGLTATITPSSATSKILILVQVTIGMSTGNDIGYAVRLSGGNTAGYIGDAAGGRTQGIFGARVTDNGIGAQASFATLTENIMYLDSPNTTSATTYEVQVVRNTGGTVAVNQPGTVFTTAVNQTNGTSSITVIEVAV